MVRTVDTAAVVKAVSQELELEMMRGDIDDVRSQDQVAIIAVVGAAMRGQPGIASSVFHALAKQEINIISIAQGSSNYNLSLVVAQDDVDEGVRAIHKQFELDKI